MKTAIVVLPEKCSGCKICEVACSLRNSGECNPERARIKVVKEETDGQLELLPSTCMQCETALCELVCPMSAISRHPETGAKIIDHDRCVGCSSCSYVCPFGACFVDRRIGKSVVCSLCDGDPTCVRLCPSGALQLVPHDEVNAFLKRHRANRVIEARRLTMQEA